MSINDYKIRNYKAGAKSQKPWSENVSQALSSGCHDASVCFKRKPGSISPRVIAFAQNTREEVRILGEDGNVAGCVSAESGSHQTTYLSVRHKRKDSTKESGESSFFRAGSYGKFEPTQASGTLDCGHLNTIGNGTPCLVVQTKGA